MTTMALPMIGASSANSETWESINWMSVEKLVNRLQMRIAKATSVVAGSNKLWPYQMLERSAAKAACCVLMGASFR